MSKGRRGPFSAEEKKYIQNNSDNKTDAEIAEYLGRTESAVKRIRTRELAIAKKTENEDEERAQLRSLLFDRYYWKNIQKQFTDDELELFVNMWIGMFIQFNKDVVQSEEDSIIDYCRLEILKNRFLNDRQSSHRRMIGLEEKLERFIKEHGKPPYLSDDHQKMYDRIQESINSLQSNLGYKGSELEKLNAQQLQLRKELKATRDQRVKVLESSKKSLHDWIQALRNDRYREEEGKMMSMIDEASEKEYERLTEFHEYVDGTADLPILNSDSVQKIEKE